MLRQVPLVQQVPAQGHCAVERATSRGLSAQAGPGQPRVESGRDRRGVEKAAGGGEDGSVEPPIERLEGVRGLYLGMNEAKVDRMLDEHCAGGRVIVEWVETYT